MSRASQLRITFLGTGTSHGVPMIACECAVCTSSDPHDQRSRCSICIESRGSTVIVDTGPEFRLQCLTHRVRRCNAVLYTHHHMDHIAGLDDLRRFNVHQSGPLPCFAQPETLSRLRQVFPYVESMSPAYPSAKPHLRFIEIAGPFEAAGLSFVPVPLWHGDMRVLGFRIGRFAYCTDVSSIPDDSMPLLRGLDVLVLGALRRKPHPTHMNLDTAVQVAGQIGAGMTFFTHIAHELPHAATNATLPRGMALAHDGQIVEL